MLESQTKLPVQESGPATIWTRGRQMVASLLESPLRPPTWDSNSSIDIPGPALTGPGFLTAPMTMTFLASDCATMTITEGFLT